mmetsp:Transcript_20621/g.43347  ORF Transcript_20621/g.43347 Transcript_20621/m.43347 type:complete len:355 (+) Transcript_20621:221-1285(+)
MRGKGMKYTLLAVLSACVECQQSVKLTTKSANFHLSMTSEPDQTFSLKHHFQFESATSKLFQENISDYTGEKDRRAVVTSVHVEHIQYGSGDAAASSGSYSLDSIVSVTFSEVGLVGSTITTLNKDKDIPSLSAALNEIISGAELKKVLVEEGLAGDDNKILKLSFSDFDGSVEQRGLYSNDAEIVSIRTNEGWPMFFAGVMVVVMLVCIWLVGSWIYKKETRDDEAASGKESSCQSVHYDGDVDLEVATTASGVLGLKGHHPVVDQENMNPNMMGRRKRRGGSTSQKTATTDDMSDLGHLSPMSDISHQTNASAASKHPLGITSMRKLNTFLTPQKPKSDRVPNYNISRLADT